jgi:circadian clock protein KaiC
VAYLFDEDEGLLRERAAGVGLEVEPHLESGRLILQQVDAADSRPASSRTRWSTASRATRRGW